MMMNIEFDKMMGATLSIDKKRSPSKYPYAIDPGQKSIKRL